MVVQQKENVLVLVVNWKLGTVQIVESSSPWLQQQTHHERKHEHVQLVIQVDGPSRSLSQIEVFLSHFQEAS